MHLYPTLSTRSLTLLILSFIVLVLLLSYVLFNGNSLIPDVVYGFGNADTAFSPHAFTVDVQFSEHDEYKDLSPEYDHLWDELLTENGGFLIQEDPKERQLKRYGIGMFHQLHCLQMIRGSLQAATASRRNHMYGRHAHGDDDLADDHILHCFDYLRQAILCMADSTVEVPKRLPDGRHMIDGVDIHQCRNPEPLYELSRSSPEYHAPARYSQVNES